MAILNPNRVELPFNFQGHALTMVFDAGTIARFEMGTGVSVITLMTEMAPLTPEQIEAGHPPKQPPRISLMAELLLAALLEQHPEAELSDAMAMLGDEAVLKLFGKGLTGAMPQAGDAGEDGEAAAANPPNRAQRRAAKSRSAGKTG